MFIQVLYNADIDSPLGGYMAGDPLSEQWAGELTDLPDGDLAAMSALFTLFNEDYDRPEEWDAHRLGMLGRLPDRDIRCGDVVVVERERAYRSTELHWERIELPNEPS